MNGFVPTQAPGSTMLSVSGMTCEGCARTIERVLARVPGVNRATVDFDRCVATAHGSAAPTEMIAAVEAADYGASPAGGDNTDLLT